MTAHALAHGSLTNSSLAPSSLTHSSLAPSLLAAAACTTPLQRPLIDVMAERVARALLAWSDRRTELRVARQDFSHERMALILANEHSAPRGGSALAR